MNERYPDDYWLADFERRLSDGRLLTHEESLALIAELRRVKRAARGVGAVPGQAQPAPEHVTL